MNDKSNAFEEVWTKFFEHLNDQLAKREEYVRQKNKKKRKWCMCI